MNDIALINAIWRVEYIISVFLAFIMFYLPMKKRKLTWAYVLVGFLIMFGVWALRSALANDVFNVISYLIIYVLIFLTLHLSLDVDYGQSLFLSTCVICLQHFSFKVNYALIALIDVELRHTLYYFISYLAVIAASDVLFYFLFTKNLKDNTITNRSFLTLVIAIVTVVTAFFIAYFTQHEVINNLNKVTIALLQVYGIVLPLVCVAVLFQNMVYLNVKRDNEILSIISEKDKERYNFAKNTIDLINIKYHDLKHALENEDIVASEKEEIVETVTNYSALAFSGNRILDIVLYEMKLKSEKQGVHIISIVDGSLLDFMQNNHIYSMFCNLLENAIESAQKMQDEDKRNIRLSISKSRGSVVISLENYFGEKLEFVQGMPRSTKSDKENHGFGLRSVGRIVEHYHGILSVGSTDDVFKIKIVFPFTDNN